MLNKHYQPQNQESRIYSLWEEASIFKANSKSKKQPFCIIMPPPNANAPLHIGHAMFVTLEDILSRFHRMMGKEVLWLPGADHAGILTQVVFEKELSEEGKNRYGLGREKFFKACYKFTQKNKKIMYGQIKRLGASCDWSREKFTLDSKISQVVLKTFVKLHQDGLAYRGERMINWCPRCMTALSDLEVEHKEEKSLLWFIKYPLKTHSTITGQKRYLVVATTRPETMLGDTAVAVHPDDFRYKKFIGQKALLPIVEKEIPVIADKAVDPGFGTGAVKVTPAHDPEDLKIAKRHQLPSRQVIGFDNKMTKQAGKEFEDLSILEAREKVLKILRKKDLLLNTKKYTHSVGYCERCKTKIEPQISLQWFIKTKLLAKRAIAAVKKKEVKILPKRFEKTYFQWLENIEDWCVSRQLWWGHRMPVWYCGLKGLSGLQKEMNPELIKSTKDSPCSARRVLNRKKIEGCGQVMVSLEKPKKCPKCGNTNIIQDPDTFDCWFSSGQWPYTTLGFDASRQKSQPKAGQPLAEKLTDFDYWYPTSVMETGYEILFFWVARMIMLGIYRTGKVPFKTVYLHGLVRDAFGQKMSKSKGNVINPLGVIEKYGADALRLALITGTAPGNDVSISEDKIRGYRNFCNKLWNIGRFISLQFEQIAQTTSGVARLSAEALAKAGRDSLEVKSKVKDVPFYNSKMKGLTKEDKKIVGQLNTLIKKTTKNLQNYCFSSAAEDLYHFVWHQFADKYIESSKKRLQENDRIALSVLRHVFLNCLKMLHPFIPFVTEVLWQEIPKKKKELLIVSSWPTR